MLCVFEMYIPVDHSPSYKSEVTFSIVRVLEVCRDVPVLLTTSKANADSFRFKAISES